MQQQYLVDRQEGTVATTPTSFDRAREAEEFHVRQYIVQNYVRNTYGGSTDDFDEQRIYDYARIPAARPPAFFRARIRTVNVSVFVLVFALFQLVYSTMTLCSISGNPASPDVGWVYANWIFAGLNLLAALLCAANLSDPEDAVEIHWARQTKFHHNDAAYMIVSAVVNTLIAILYVVWYATGTVPKVFPISVTTDTITFLGQYGLNVMFAACNLPLVAVGMVMNNLLLKGGILHYTRLVLVPTGETGTSRYHGKKGLSK